MALLGWVCVSVCFELALEDGAGISGVVECGVIPKVLPEGLNHIRDGGTDSSGKKGVLVCFLVQVVTDAVGEACEDELLLRARVGVEEGVFDLALGKVGLKPAESASLLGEGWGGDSTVCGMERSVDSIHEEIVFGRGYIRKVLGTWEGLA